jgi:imidazolonepropionase-like amidohydrolase
MRVFLVGAAVVSLTSCGGSAKPPSSGTSGAIELDVTGAWNDPTGGAPRRTAAATAADRAAAARNPAARSIAITGGTVLAATGQRFSPGLVLLDGGAITYAGAAGREVPAGAQVIDARGKTVTPGVIDAHSHLGVYASPAVTATQDGNEMTAPVTAQVRAEYGYWPQDPGITRARAGGVTTALILPGSGNLIGGRGFTVIMRPGRTTDDVRFPGAPATVKMACGENPKRSYGEKGGPQTRMAEYSAFRTAFQQATEYRASQRAYDLAHAEWDRKRARAGELEAQAAREGRTGKVRPEPAPTRPPRDLGLETLSGVLSGDVLVQVHCYKAEEMRQMIGVADDLGFHIRAFHHALEAYKIRDLLAAHDIAVATWSDWWGFKMEAFDGIRENAGFLQEAGGRPVIHSDSEYGIQRLNQEAGKAMHAARAAGLDVTEDDAIRWVTANPAWVLGIDDVVGTLEKGKRADVVVWNTSPFSVYSRADVVIQAGEVTYERAQGIEATDFEVGNSSITPWRVGPVAGAASGAGAVPGAPARLGPAEKSFAIRGATVVAAPGQMVKNATVVVQNGRIVSVGTGAPPAGMPVIDGTGKVVTAGLVDASSRLGMVEVELEASTVDGQFDNKNPVHAAYRVTDGYNPDSVAIPVARAAGVTSVVSVPAGGLVSGTSAWMSLATGVKPQTLTVASPVAMLAALGEAAAGAADGSRGAAFVRLRELLDDAAQYAKRRGNFERNQTRAFAASRLDLEALVPVVRGQLPLVVRTHRATDIRAALRMARELKLRLVIEGGAEAWMVAEELAAAKVPVMLNPIDNLPSSFEHIHVRDDAAALLDAAGVEVAITPIGSSTGVRNLAQLAGNAVATGLPYDKALAAITSVPAHIFGVAARGTLAKGNVADLVVWSGDPLEIGTRAEHVFIGGAEQPTASRQDGLRDRYRTLGPGRRGAAAAR